MKKPLAFVVDLDKASGSRNFNLIFVLGGGMCSTDCHCVNE